MSFFEAKGIEKSFSGIDISFSFTAEKNTIPSLTGPSGSGKSTALRIIAGLEKSNAEIFLDGTKISSLPMQKKNIGFVFQEPSLFMNMSVEENITFALKCRGFKKSERKEICRKLLERTGLAGFEGRSPSSLSGGEAQRVCLARTLSVKPKLILLDEPFSALDIENRKSLSSLIISLKDEGHSFIMVTHDTDEARRMSDRIVFIKKGKKLFDGLPSDFSDALFKD